MFAARLACDTNSQIFPEVQLFFLHMPFLIGFKDLL